MRRFDAKRVSDPVYGPIGLSELEVAVINTPVYQRLRNVKQLGLAHFVFPGADYSRFSHSLGACHIMGRILEAILRDEGAANLSEKDLQLYRLAALLHDVGHYPFSHAMEVAVQNHYSERLLMARPAATDHESIASDDNLADRAKPFMHERLGKEVLLEDEQLSKVLKGNDIDPEDVSTLFMREKPRLLSNLISSDLDADRIDYLVRTAHHTGLPYGSVDVDYLISQMRVDANNRVCITRKALRTADHFLLCRYFDYQQVTYHHTVAAIELVLKDVLAELLAQERIDCSRTGVSATIASGNWCAFDDTMVLQEIRKLRVEAASEAVKAKAAAILERRPPKLLAEAEYLGSRRDLPGFRSERQLVRKSIQEWADHFGIDRSMWYIWDNEGMALTKIGSNVPVSVAMEEGTLERDKYEQAIRILNDRTGDSVPITQVRRSLMSVLADQAVYSLRVYVLPSADTPIAPDWFEEVRRRIRADLPDLAWG